MDFDLDRLGPTEFEHLVQSLAKLELGNGVTVFGAGADGGREATFSGAVPFPVGDGDTWNGYGVVQAKHRRFPSEDAGKNADWLIRQLEGELDRWKPGAYGKKMRSPLPEYYLIATNVRLSPDPEGGGKGRVRDALKSHANDLNLRGFFVWDYDEICAMIRNHLDVRRCFGGFITSGDVLAAAGDFFEARDQPSARSVRINAAQQLVSKQWVRMSDSGSDDGSKLPLAGVGIDLPSLGENLRDGPDGQEFKTIARILEKGDVSLTPEFRGANPFAVVLVGGPGQGKSTLAHMICQIYRTALLAGSDLRDFAPAVRNTLASTQRHLAATEITLPVHHRWPVYVELSKFADALAADPESSLARFIAQGMSVNGEKMLGNQLLTWFASWPTTLVLDGLDEVPTAGIRELVIERINDFVIEAHGNRNDLFIVATTRPQGYHGEFGSIAPETLNLRDLTPEEGVAYGTRVVAQRHRDDPDQELVVRGRLETAALQPNTARLMKSPLQVTIMSVLFNRLQKAPPTRHGLFDAYYDAVYAREVSKAKPAGQVLEKYKDDVDYVHEQVALYLHVRAEIDGEAEARLNLDELRGLFEKRLVEQDHDPKGAQSLVDQLMKASTERLVLLVASRPGEFSFEIRSLQEYMAARAITSGRSEAVLDRLMHLAPSAHWRNAWLLAASRMFARDQHLRAEFIVRLRGLDNASEVAMLIGTGKRLALDLLADGISIASPLFTKALLTLALELTRGWAGPEIPNLARIVEPIANEDDSSYNIFKGVLSEAFESEGKSKIAAVLLMRTLEKNAGKAGAISDRLLKANLEWRPTTGTARAETARLGGADLLNNFGSEGFSEDDLQARRSIIAILSGLEFRTRLTPAECATVAKQEISIGTVLNLQPHLVAARVREGLAVLANEAPVQYATLAIWLRKAVTNLVERESVGGSPLISSPGEGLF